MATPDFFLRLHDRVKVGLADLEPPEREGHRDQVLARVQTDGGFAGRSGGSDIYYTGFAIQVLDWLAALTPERAGAVRDFLRASPPETIVDQVQWLHGAIILKSAGHPLEVSAERVASFLAGFRTPDGGYGKLSGANEGSTYWTYLALLAYQALGLPFPEPKKTAAFLADRVSANGGFRELGRARRGTTNATAAGIGAGLLLGAGSMCRGGRSTAFLREMAVPGGGFRAGGKAPVADLLSTFTVVVTLLEDGAKPVDFRAARQFLDSCRMVAGGFRAGPWDDAPDIEYTFYGLGLQALLNAGK